MIWHDVEQNSDEWFALKLGQPGGSSAATYMAHLGKDFGEPAQRLALRLALERVTGRRISDGVSNRHTERGHEQEPVARALYEEEYFCTVTNGGYFTDGECGDSPDGLVDDDGVVEIKSVISSVHEANIKRGKPDPAYKWQLISHLDATGRDWVDFVSYCEDYPEWLQLCVYRVLRKDVLEEIEQFRERRAQFIKLVKAKVDEINGRK